MRNIVLLPQPDGPSSTRNEPSGTEKLTSETAFELPKDFVILSREITVWPQLKDWRRRPRRSVAAPVASMEMIRMTSVTALANWWNPSDA